MSAEHWFKLATENVWNGSTHSVQPVVYGVSHWDIQDGRLRREMRRTTKLTDVKSVRRWAKRFSDVSASDIEQAVTHIQNRAH